MPDSGEAGCICARYEAESSWVEFRGPPYSQWDVGGVSKFELLHGNLNGAQVSVLHAGGVLAILPKHKEYGFAKELLDGVGDTIDVESVDRPKK